MRAGEKVTERKETWRKKLLGIKRGEIYGNITT